MATPGGISRRPSLDVSTSVRNALIEMYRHYNEMSRTQERAIRASLKTQVQRELYRENRNLSYEMWRRENLVQESARARLNTQIERDVRRGFDLMAKVSATDILKATADGAGDEVATTLGIIAKVYNKAIDQRWRQIAKINQQVADRAIEDMLFQYDRVRRDNPRGDTAGANYRPGERYGGGKLRSALSNPLQATVGLDGVSFLNTSLLDRYAVQWARLNFGAGSRARTGDNVGGKPGKTLDSIPDITGEFFSSAIQAPSFNVRIPYGPKGAFRIPYGLWIRKFDSGGTTRFNASAGGAFSFPDKNARGSDAFFVKRNIPYFGMPYNEMDKAQQKTKWAAQPPRMTAGVQAWGFIETGVRSLARNLPAANMAWMLKILKESQDDVTAGIAGKVVAIDQTQLNASISLLENSLESYLSAGGNINRSISRRRFIEGLL